jgi:hypothetical protein
MVLANLVLVEQWVQFNPNWTMDDFLPKTDLIDKNATIYVPSITMLEYACNLTLYSKQLNNNVYAI